MIRVKPFCLSAFVGLFLIAACAATPEQQAALEDEQARLEAEIAARQGEPQSRICPRGSDDWKALGDNVVLLEARGEWFMVELAGTCDPDDAFAGIATRSSPGSSCLSRGDEIFTGLPRSGERCTITSIHGWNENVEFELPETSAAVQLEED
ncbi:MAG: DUF6491 family protein [Pseudomonadota bacterium]